MRNYFWAFDHITCSCSPVADTYPRRVGFSEQSNLTCCKWRPYQSSSLTCYQFVQVCICRVCLSVGVRASSAVGSLGCWQSCLCSVLDQACETHGFSRSFFAFCAHEQTHMRTNYSSAWVSEDSSLYKGVKKKKCLLHQKALKENQWT